MDRQTVYSAQILPETVLLQMAKDSMIGLAKLSAAMLGTSTIANGFAVTPTGPASLQVLVAPGEIYSLASIDATAYSSLAADTTHSIMKQGVLLDGLTLNCPAPGTAGQSINYLVEAIYQDLDASPVLLPYYNSANPALPYSGQGNNGLTQNTVRKGAAVVAVKAGASAATGSQVTPAPDAGYVGLYVVTVAFGQTTIVAGNIAASATAPFINSTLHGLSPTFTVSPLIPVATLAGQAAQFSQTAGRLLNIQVFTVLGAQTYTPTPGTTSVVVEVQAGGGGGGACVSTTSGQYATGSAGQGGGYAKSRLTTGFSGASVVVGSGGVGGTASTNNAVTGGASSFGATVSATGGAGGALGTVQTAASIINSLGAPGAGSGGNICNIAPPSSPSTICVSATAASSAPSGGAVLGGGVGPSSGSHAGAANVGLGYGGGGGGAQSNQTATAFAGGAGAPGVVIIWEYA